MLVKTRVLTKRTLFPTNEQGLKDDWVNMDVTYNSSPPSPAAAAIALRYV